jgi:hypothetical protein
MKLTIQKSIISVVNLEVKKYSMKISASLLFCFLSVLCFAQVTININSVPPNTPATDDIYIAGTFNSWNPGNSSYKLNKIDASHFTISLANGTGAIEFKFTSWQLDKVECHADGSFFSEPHIHLRQWRHTQSCH